jgi:radical SAM superfamily enzyme YgiQ (UPF0313 family)
MPRAVLINTPLTARETAGPLSSAAARVPPLGLVALASASAAAGVDARIIDAANFNLGYSETVDRCLELNPDLVGLTSVTVSIHNAADIAARLKKARPDLTVVVGGVHVTAAPEETMARFPCFDMGVLGEGDETMTDIMRRPKDTDPEKIAGLIIRKNGALILSPPRRPVADLNALPLSRWDLLPDLPRHYRPAMPVIHRLPSATLMTSRGCPGKCIFCNTGTVSGRHIRAYDADVMIREIDGLVTRYGIRDLNIYDVNFVALGARLSAIHDLWVKKGYDLSMSVYARVDDITEEKLDLLRRMGCWQITFGLESGAQPILDLIRKGFTLETASRALALTHQKKIRSRGLFMIGHPGETEETVQATLDFLLDQPLDDFHITYFTPLPGTVSWDMAETYGRFEKDWEKMSCFQPVYFPHGVTRAFMAEKVREAYRRFYFRPRILGAYLKSLSTPGGRMKCYHGGKALLASAFRGPGTGRSEPGERGNAC